jgi:argininosuccinate lyase
MALVEKLGPLGYKLHTARSRNELVATDFRMFVKDAAREISRGVAALVYALIDLAERTMGVPLAGMTHLQHAQPILFSHFILAHAEAFFRDLERLSAALHSADSCPLGSGALGGSSFPIDRAAMAKELGFSRISANSLDAVGDRDFAIDYLYALAGLATHISRLAEDFVLFASLEFGYVLLPDAFSTGSSLMPQKKNPDAWELLRGKTGRMIGSMISVLVTLKGLPSSYQRDLQEDKEPVFAAHDQALAVAQIAAGAVGATKVDEKRLVAAAQDSALLATQAAHYLVRRGLPFRQAHEVVGRMIREAERTNESWTSMPLSKLKSFSPLFESDLAQVLTLESALASCDVPGGTAPSRVRGAIAGSRERLERWTNSIGQRKEPE